MVIYPAPLRFNIIVNFDNNTYIKYTFECKLTCSTFFLIEEPITYLADVAIRLNDNLFDYRILSLIGEIQSPKIIFDPPFICFTPVPLDITAGVDIRILPQNYFR